MPSTPYSLAILPIVLSAVVAPVTPAHAGPPLSGTYTIGASGTFPNLAAAVSAVTTDGAAGPVTFEIQSGVYAQQLGIFGEIPGASAVSRVRFTSQTGNADDVTLVRSANRGYLSDAVVLFSRARFVSVDHLTLLGSGTEEFVGGAIVLPGHWYRTLVGLVLWASAVRLWLNLRLQEKHEPPMVAAMLCGAGIGLLAGLTGTGGGIFLSPLLLFMGWAETRETGGVSAAFILVNSLAGLAGNPVA